MLNTLDETVEKEAVWTEMGSIDCNHQVTDVWSGYSLGRMSGYFSNVSSHDTAMILVGGVC